MKKACQSHGAGFVCAAILSFFCIADGFSQENALRFRHITTREGLLSDDIRCIYQDRDGFMWFGGEGSLDRFDGRNFIDYYQQIRDTSVSILQSTGCIYEDSYKGIWFVNDVNGVVWMNKETGHSERFRYNPDDPESLSGNIVLDILEDKEKNLWFASYGGGLMRFNRTDSSFTCFLHDSTDVKSIGSNDITSIAEDRQGGIWLSTADGLMIYRDPQTGHFENIRVNQGRVFGLALYSMPHLYIDSSNHVWFLSGWEAFRYNPSNKKLRTVNLFPDKKDVSIFVFLTGMIEYEKGSFLFTTHNSGLFWYNEKNGSIKNIASSPYNPFSPGSDRLSVICRSHDDVIWIGSFDNGISVLSKNTLRFNLLTDLVGFEYLRHANHSIYSLTELPDGRIITGTDNKGLFVFNPSGFTIEPFLPEMGDFSIYDVYREDTGRLWICAWRNGLYYYDKASEKLVKAVSDTGLPFMPQAQESIRLLKDRKNRLWFAQMTGGLIMYDPVDRKTRQFSPVPNDTTTLSGNMVFKILEDSRGQIWVGTNNGLSYYDDRQGKFKRIKLVDASGREASNVLIYDLFEDKERCLWIGSTGTLHWYNPASGRVKAYPYQENNANYQVTKILRDAKGYLWLGTNAGILRFDPQTATYKSYGRSDGIHYLVCNPTVGLSGENGQMYFGTAKGILVFNPMQITDDTVPPRVFITAVRVNDVPLSPDTHGAIIKKTIPYVKSIKLNHKQSNLSIAFAALSYINPEGNQFAYRLEGYDPDWIRGSRAATAFYPNLRPGKYVFRVIASNSHGIWNQTGQTLMIHIRPPFWSTWFFRLLMLLALSALVVAIHLTRTLGLKQQKVLLEGLVNERTSALNAANEELKSQHEELLQQNEEISSQNEMLASMGNEILQQNAELEEHRSHLQQMVEERTRELEMALHKAEESDRLKSAFLANMSHEIRTPMNAIVGFSNLLKDDSIDPAEKDEFIDVINANSEILLVLIDDILDLSLIEANQLTIRKEILHVNEILDHLYSAFSLMNKKNGLIVRLNNEVHDLDIRINSDRIRIKQILTNLLNNAYKFTEEGTIELGLRIKDENLHFYVSDTGIGIHKNEQDKIFERFRKSEEKTNTLFRGTGLGLAISRALAQLLGGSLTVDSALGRGSVFTLVLPFQLTAKENHKEKPIRFIRDSGKTAGKQVLVVEDEQANFLYISKVLKQMGAEVHWAENGLEAVKLLSSGIHFDLVLMDIKMPVMDGFEATKAIREKHPDQVIIALTAYARPEDRNYFMQAGFQDYLSKPIKPNDFTGVINRFIG